MVAVASLAEVPVEVSVKVERGSEIGVARFFGPSMLISERNSTRRCFMRNGPEKRARGAFNSSRTRVEPVFDQLWEQGRDWLPTLLELPKDGCAGARVKPGDLTIVDGRWESKKFGMNEQPLGPPVSLLQWLIRNVGRTKREKLLKDVDFGRKELASDKPEIAQKAVEDALRLLRENPVPRAWYIFEGPTHPDVYLVAKDALVVIEGKRTEATATEKTEWLDGRHQIWRHIDAAWEIRGPRDVYGFFIVEADRDSKDGAVPEHWRREAEKCLKQDALRTNFPYRSAHEIAAISRCFLGVTTWRKVCDRFGIDYSKLPETA